MTLCVESAAPTVLPMTNADSEKVVTLLTCMPNGLIELSMDVAGLPQTSLNLGILTTSENEVSASFCVGQHFFSKRNA